MGKENRTNKKLSKRDVPKNSSKSRKRILTSIHSSDSEEEDSSKNNRQTSPTKIPEKSALDTTASPEKLDEGSAESLPEEGSNAPNVELGTPAQEKSDSHASDHLEASTGEGDIMESPQDSNSE